MSKEYVDTYIEVVNRLPEDEAAEFIADDLGISNQRAHEIVRELREDKEK